MHEKLEKLLSYKQYQHNRNAAHIFNLTAALLEQETITDTDYFEYCLDVAIVKGNRDYPALTDRTLNAEFWSLLDSLDDTV